MKPAGRARLTSDVGPFGITPLWLLDSGISDRAIRLYATIAARWADRDGKAWPSRQAMAKALAVSSLRTVDAAVEELEGIGALTVEGRRDEDGGQVSNVYRLRFAAPDPDGGGAADCTTPCNLVHGGVQSDDTPPVQSEGTPPVHQIAHEPDPIEPDPENQKEIPPPPLTREEPTNVTAAPSAPVRPTETPPPAAPSPGPTFRPPTTVQTDQATANRAGAFLERYPEVYRRVRNGAHYLVRPVRDYGYALELVTAWPDLDRLALMLEVFLRMSAKDANNVPGTVGQFLHMAPECDARLRQHGR